MLAIYFAFFVPLISIAADADDPKPQEILDSAALKQAANLKSIRTWSGTVKYTLKREDGAPLQRTATFAVDLDKERYFCKVVREKSHGRMLIFLDGNTYSVTEDAEGRGKYLRIAKGLFPKAKWSAASDVFEPLGAISPSSGDLQSIADTYRRFADAGAVSQIFRSVTVEGDILTTRHSDPKTDAEASRKKWDLSKGANLIEFSSEYGGTKYEWKKYGESWLPAKIDYVTTGPSDRDKLEYHYDFVESSVNEPIDWKVFNDAIEEAKAGAEVSDIRARFAAPFGK